MEFFEITSGPLNVHESIVVNYLGSQYLRQFFKCGFIDRWYFTDRMTGITSEWRFRLNGSGCWFNERNFDEDKFRGASFTKRQRSQITAQEIWDKCLITR